MWTRLTSYWPQIGKLGASVLLRTMLAVLAKGLLLVSAGALVVNAQDQCTALSQNGLYNTYRTNSGNSNVSQSQSQFCSDYNSYKQTGVQGNIAASYELFSGSANFSQSAVDAVGQAVCTSNFSASSASSMLNTFASVVESRYPNRIYRLCECFRVRD